MSYLLPPNAPRWIKITKTYADFSTAALTNDIEIYSQKVNEIIHSVLIKSTQEFTGGLLPTYTLSVGYAGALTSLSGNSVLNVFQAPSNSVYLQSNNSAPIIKSFSGATSVRAAAISTVANLDAATQGSVDFYILISTLP